MRKNKDLTKKCPRCGEKCFKVQSRCDGCGLIFDRMKYASNKAAKVAIAKREKEKVIKVTELPKDLKRSKLLILSGCFGLVGAHNLYVGRYIKGFFSLIVFLITAVCILLEGIINYAPFFESFFFIPAGISFFLWFYDFAMIAIKKYKVPIALDYEGVDVL